MREEGKAEEAAVAKVPAAHLWPRWETAVAGHGHPGEVSDFSASRARPNSALFLVKQRPPLAQAATLPPAARTARETRSPEAGGGAR